MLDVSEEICPNAVCQAMTTAGLVRYRDATHISVEQSQALTQTFRRALI